MSFQDVREALICSYAAGCISDKAFLILYEEYESANLCFPYWEYGSFQLDDLERSECKAEFRVEKEDIPRIAAALPKSPTFLDVLKVQFAQEKRVCAYCCGDFLTLVVIMI